METRRSSDSSQSAGPSGCSSSQTATKRSHPSPPDVARDIMASGTGATTSHGELAQAKRSPARAHQPSSATAAASGEGEDDGSLLHASDSHPEPGTLPAGKTGRKQKAVVQQPVKDPESGQLYRCLVIDYEQENESEKYPFITEKTVSAEALLTQLKLEENSLEKFGVTPVEDAVAHIVQSRKRVYLPCTESENGLESVKRSLRQKLIKNAFKFEIEDFANEEGFKDFIKKCAEKDKGDATWFAGVLAEASRDVDVSEVIDVPGHIERQLLLHDREALYGEIVTAIRQNHLDEMDKIRQAEPRQLKLLRQRLIQERLQFQSEQEAKARLAAQQQTQQQHGPMASLGVAAPAPSASIPGGLPPCSAGMGPTPPRGPLAAQTPIHGMTDAGMTVHPSALGFQTIVDSGTRTHDPQSFLSAHALQQHPPPVQPQFTASHRRDMDGAAARGPNFGMAMPEAVGVSFSRQTPVYESEEHAMRMSEGYPGMSVNLPAQQSPPFQPQFTESHWRDMGSAGAQEPNFGMAMPEAVGFRFRVRHPCTNPRNTP
ncbi:uncharacterized protein LOC129590956 [Paramacrobiotus metropolitanus]|uniref:uncharacterized protein LOC129590956 n=1 Tax=Paramacrobiotus metropolitanus TaxID=2943436 RepID=UPI002445CD26|nr:uncharacterized protein LOC129590956 [Paramacrobiotus metropolitanus]